MNLAIEKLIGLVIMVIIIISMILFVFMGKGMGLNIGKDLELRNCCDEFRNNGCNINEISSIYCSEDGVKTMETIAEEAGYNIENLPEFCGCHENSD
ncbi:MAG: hypothetical protein PHU12_02940 [Candidatus Aenigmarchaeota archaeon]|nr:hypothetical protein [Candidatus Aenigmarchaeota archaeon]